METQEFRDIRPSPIAGTWYPGDPNELRQLIESFLQAAKPPQVPGEILGIIVPHAGMIYSGLTAAHAFKTLMGKSYQRVILLSPSHQYYREPLLTTGHEAYSTPLGLVPVDRDALGAIQNALSKSLGLEATAVRRDREHSLEIELPFLQVVLSDSFSLVPFMLVDQSPELVRGLADAIAAYVRSLPTEEHTLLVASSDLSHYYSESQANQMDSRVLKALEAMDLPALYRLNAAEKAKLAA
jgi:AmmeMemoRadiSam system protein B